MTIFIFPFYILAIQLNPIVTLKLTLVRTRADSRDVIHGLFFNVFINLAKTFFVFFRYEP